MNTTDTTASIKNEIALALGFDPERPPLQMGDKDAAFVLGIKTSTLAAWRTSGRYRLPYIRVGRLVKYRTSDIADFLVRSTTTKTA